MNFKASNTQRVLLEFIESAELNMFLSKILTGKYLQTISASTRQLSDQILLQIWEQKEGNLIVLNTIICSFEKISKVFFPCLRI